jgi:glycosyltransferase involved in cell wall biosynthesis
MRGAEREVHDVGTGLAQRGHQVRLVTSQPTGLTSTARYDGLRVRYVRAPFTGALVRRGLKPEGAFAVPAAGAALLSRADAVISYHYPDAYGVSLADRATLRRRPRVLKLTGSVPRWYHDKNGRRLDRELLRRALAAADEVWVNSPYVVEAMADHGVPMQVVPAGVDTDAFAPRAPRSDVPVVLCTAAPDERRKRMVDLLDGWPLVREALPEAQLHLAQSVSDSTRASLLERLPSPLRSSVVFLGRLSGEELASACSSAWVVVAPAIHEALGLATLEALACGTPVAGARSGATPWLLDQPGTGALFEPLQPVALAEAVVAAASLATAPGTVEACRASALRFAWPDILDRVEQRLEGLRR